jgi:hypothetical protein
VSFPVVDLTEHQLRVLLCVAACRKTMRRAPRLADYRKAFGSETSNSAMATITALITRGLLTQRWVHGKRIPGTLAPTPAAWAQLGEAI